MAISYKVWKDIDKWCINKTLGGSLTIIFCIFKQTGYHMSLAMKSGMWHLATASQ